jgi:hypothetical protein
MEAAMGCMPEDEERFPLDIRVEEEADCGSYLPAGS